MSKMLGLGVWSLSSLSRKSCREIGGGKWWPGVWGPSFAPGVLFFGSDRIQIQVGSCGAARVGRPRSRVEKQFVLLDAISLAQPPVAPSRPNFETYRPAGSSYNRADLNYTEEHKDRKIELFVRFSV